MSETKSENLQNLLSTTVENTEGKINQVVVAGENKINQVVVAGENKINQAIDAGENKINKAIVAVEDKINKAIVDVEDKINQVVAAGEDKINQAITSPHTPEVATSLAEVATKIYAGRDIHAYTGQVNQAAAKYKDIFVGEMDATVFETILSEMLTAYGPKESFLNLRNVFHNGCITDPDVPMINVAILLQKVWNQVKEFEQKERAPESTLSFKAHFNQTLNDIGMTCIQGISHRLLIDFVAFCTD